MAWSKDRKRFIGALSLFLVWVVLLSALAIVSAYRPAARSALPDRPAASGETGMPGTRESRESSSRATSNRVTDAGASTQRKASTAQIGGSRTGDDGLRLLEGVVGVQLLVREHGPPHLREPCRREADGRPRPDRWRGCARASASDCRWPVREAEPAIAEDPPGDLPGPKATSGACTSIRTALAP